MEALIAAVRAADQDTLYSFYYPAGGRVRAAAVAGCVCLDDLTCADCDRILGVSFELAARKKQRTDPPVPVARTDSGPWQGQGLGPGSLGVEGRFSAISSDTTGLTLTLGPTRGGQSGNLKHGGPAWAHPPSEGIEGPGAGAVISSTADRLGTVSNGGVEVAISGTVDPAAPGSHPPSHGVDGSDAAFSGTADSPVPGSDPPSDEIEWSGPAIPSMADRLGAVSSGVAEGFEAGISGMATRLGLAAAVGERAKEVFRKMEESRAWPPCVGRGKGRRSFLSERPLVYAACLSIACRAEGSALLLRELAMAASAGGGVAKKDIVRLVEHIRSRLGKEEAGHLQPTGISAVSVSSYVRRFGELVGLREAEAAAALEVARRLEAGVVDVRHNADTVAAGVVCRVLERAGGRRPGAKDVAAASGLSGGTIYTVCRKLRRYDGLLFG